MSSNTPIDESSFALAPVANAPIVDTAIEPATPCVEKTGTEVALSNVLTKEEEQQQTDVDFATPTTAHTEPTLAPADNVSEAAIEETAPELNSAMMDEDISATTDEAEPSQNEVEIVEVEFITEAEPDTTKEAFEAVVTAKAESDTTKETAEATKTAVTPLAVVPRKRITALRPSALALLALFLISLVMPLSIGVSYGVSAYDTYQTLRMHASSGLQHLLNVKQIFVGAHSDSSSILDTNKLIRANKELAEAQQNFTQVQTLLNRTPAVRFVDQYLPQYRSQISTARAASQIGIDITSIGQSVIGTALVLAPRFRNPLLAMNHAPLVTANDIDLIGRTIDSILPRLNDMQQQTRALSLADLPISSQTRNQIQQYIPLLPRAKSILSAIRTQLGPGQWLLGLDGPRTFLVQTMDPSELRATGGFTGQYGELQIDGGRIAPFSLHDIALLEYSGNSSVNGQLAPSAYRSWWPFANWGLRDSNLSADFPTSARLAIAQYKAEVKHNVDGVILLTPFLIQDILRVIGPLQIARYNETITANNLQDRLQYYQLDNAGIRRSEIIEHVENPDTARKLFTAEVARTFMDHIRRAPLNELMAIGMQLLQDLKTKDLQVYATNEQVEHLLQLYGDSAEIDRATTHDGLYVVQTNVSASKASQYVHTILHDTITLDAQGGATHVLQMRLVYNQIGPVYGLDTYRDYVRVYVPPAAKFLWGDGFDSGQPLCGGPLPECPANGAYPHQELVCPTGQYNAGYAAPMLNDPYAGAEHPLDKIGAPTTLKSDEAGRGMFGGYIVVPKNCTMTVTLSWYVPSLSNAPYNVLVQRQAGTYPELDLTVLPFPADCTTLATSGLHFDSVLTRDTAFALKNALGIRDTREECGLKA